MKKYFNCLLITLVAGTVNAQTTTQNQASTITAEQFINQAALSGMKEVATGKMAKKKAQDTKVKDYGSMMATDHDKANTELMALAKTKNIKLPKQSDIVPSTSGSTNTAAGATGTNGIGGTTGMLGTTGTTGTTGTGNSNTGTTGTTGTGNSNTGTTGTTGTGNSNTGTTGTTGTGNSNTGTTGTTGTGKSNTGTTGTTGTGNSNTGTTGTTGTGNSNTGTNGTTSTTGTSAVKMMTPTEIISAIQQLENLNGPQFDIAYTQMMVTDHQNAIALFERGAASTDPGVKAFATKHLPTLRSHLQQIQSIAGTNGPVQQSNPGNSSGSGNQ
jgi:predicted outer membrane protein